MKKIFLAFFITVFVFHSFFIKTVSAQTIAAGLNFSLSVCHDSTVKSWGYNYYGQLGLGDTIDRLAPVIVNGLTGIAAVDAGEWHFIALKNNGTVWSAGNNNNGQLGNGIIGNSSVPVQVFGLSTIRSIASGQNHCLALKNDSTVWAWGYNLYGQIGDGTTTIVACQCKPSPVPIANLNNVIALAAGGNHSLALRSDSTVWAWGKNTNGQLGDSTNNDSSIPIKVNGLNGIIAISAGGIHSLALKADGTVYSWGGNVNGQLGDSTILDINYPKQLNGLTNVMAISAGFNHSMALKSDSTIWSWGHNNYSQLGDGTLADRHFPVPASGLTGIASIEAGGVHSMAEKNNATLQAWGNDYYGLGDGMVVHFGCECRMIPITVTNWCSVVSVEETNEEDQGIIIFPNPFSVQAVISFNREQTNTLVKFHDVLGKEIKAMVLNNEKNLIIQKNEMPTGIYFLQIIDSNKNIINKKIIIQ